MLFLALHFPQEEKKVINGHNRYVVPVVITARTKRGVLEFESPTTHSCFLKVEKRRRKWAKPSTEEGGWGVREIANNTVTDAEGGK